MRKGFTLVELSIVLVIIGLLIGGVLAAQTMVSTAQVTKAIARIGEFDTALSNFKTKYNNTIPGDSPYFGGNGNNSVVADTTGFGSVAFDGEFSRYWVNLNQSGFDPGKAYTATVPAAGFDIKSTTPNGPAVPIGTQTGAVFYTTATMSGDTYHIGKISVSGTTTLVSASMKGIDAKSVDTKMDDGGASTGYVQGFSGSGIEVQAAGINGCKTSLVTSVYNITSSADKCVLLVKALSQHGN